MKTYRKIHILFADEEPAQAYADETLAQTVLERCEEWQDKLFSIRYCHSIGLHNKKSHLDKIEAHHAAHPISSALANAQDYALKTVFLCE